MDISHFLKTGKRAYLIGIGGISMNALAEVLVGRGLVVSGSDWKEGAVLTRLRSLGIAVNIGHDACYVRDVDFIIRSAAIHDDNPEVMRARELGLPVFSRAEGWGAIMKMYGRALCISGTHGKTTTTSMAAHIAIEASLDPTVMVGGTLPLLGREQRVGKRDVFIGEADEYSNSFLSFCPTVAVINNIEMDHPDFFRSLDDVIASFREFARLVPADGTVVYNSGDANIKRAIQGVSTKTLSFGLEGNAEITASELTVSGFSSEYKLTVNGKAITHVKVNIPGRHNVLNSLAAAAGSLALGIAPEHIARGLDSFRGGARRFEYKGMLNGARVYDDYAHHPTEVSAALSAAKGSGCSRVVCVFQPHTYSRTKALLDDFAAALGLADIVVLADIYAARESDTLGVSSADLQARLPNSVYLPDLVSIAGYVRSIARDGDLIYTMGAGSITEVAGMLVGG